ncbi:MAG: hypothetical protein ACHREM_09215 [Polyangiales bacterium]
MSLTQFWVLPARTRGPLGLGVTAHDIDDALAIIEAGGYVDHLPADRTRLVVKENITFDELPPDVRERMGPIVVRGIWYPWPTPGWFVQK